MSAVGVGVQETVGVGEVSKTVSWMGSSRPQADGPESSPSMRYRRSLNVHTVAMIPLGIDL